jgi:hypothetical protein
MKPIHALAIAVALAVAAVLGLSAVTKTSTLGASAKRTSAAAIATRAKKLDAFEAALQRALKNKPPALPKVPVVRAVTPARAAPTAPISLVSASTPRIVYRRPAPIIIHKHSSHRDDGQESEGVARTGGGAGDD